MEASDSLLIPVKAIVDPMGVDLILDKPTIKKNNLLQRFPSHFTTRPSS
jgi:hypothetical protein